MGFFALTLETTSAKYSIALVLNKVKIFFTNGDVSRSTSQN